MKKIIILGDSFCRSIDWIKNRPNEEKDFWVDILKKNLNDYNIITNAAPSRDVQTIIEDWIRTIRFLSSEDKLIVCLPYFRRTRLPLDNDYYFKTQIGDEIIYDRFVGTPSFNNNHESLEFWKMKNSWEYFQEHLSHQEIINATTANQSTTIEVIESLLKLTPSSVYVFSWDSMDIKSELIEDKKILREKIGKWETHQDVYYETKGEFGLIGDLHWSYNMNKLFASYLLNNFFKKESNFQ